MALKRIPVSEAAVGMFVHELCGSWMDHPFWTPRFLLKDERDLGRLQGSAVRELWIDTDKGLDVEGGQSVEEVEADTEAVLLAAAQPLPAPPKPGMDEEIGRALKFCGYAREQLDELFDTVRQGGALDKTAALELVDEVSASLDRHPHALISLARLRTASEYSAMHALAVSALMVALARQLGLAEKLVREAGLAGLLHDIGEIIMPPELLNNPGKLSKIDISMLRDHPRAGVDLLKQMPGISAAVLDVCLHHHERQDGSGYPDALKGDKTGLLAKMCAVCDVYDAISSDRPYQKGLGPAESIRKMAEWSKLQFDERVFQAFVKALGIYPVGSLVRLESGRLAVVLEQDEQSLLTPKVKVFFSARSKTPLPQVVLELAKLGGQEKIVGRESVEEWGFNNFDELWSGERKGTLSLFS
ncbi:hypothetical protein CK486_14590 [Pseudomonas sp. HAR-UPW-AIA-41]|uniref:HD-GYP domain-containing protein n=1 Tax=Pseudomonas sp. HAR-UPW-AIA-41 TaxID=1985301 RepID=UPI000BB3CD9F|nr:HD-GYP domain-containing protein [Pseudomonas sp. HAR-UPW-AIA-41]PAV47136.1 hypothetical protein CK486_14590 [Pseudomonas sp. HAR-UPW-AIA-41]